ncbi:hypothetical protein [Agromyces badenianii]|uniref:hypothetical protein n=1 Tax=Agromyces badenianii TaxID=2080742 RepID=UPI000D595F31|nr:hypothetical protein [Agromyces badenianii]PWC05405.1 hypothetical protein DCE94_03795 [Agromyces badenianii]
MIRIIHPRPELGRQSFLGVEFHDGTAEVDELHPEREQALLQHGFTLEKQLVGVPLEALSARELREAAELEGITVPAKARKAEIIALIEAAPLRTLTDVAEIDLEAESRREFMAAHTVPLGADED